MRDDIKPILGIPPREYDQRYFADIVKKLELFLDRLVSTGPVRVSDIIASGDVSVDGNTTFSGDVGLTGDITQTGNYTVTGNVDITGTLAASGNTTVGGTLSASDDISTTGDIAVGANATIGGTVDATGAISTDSTITAGDDISTTGDITAGGNASITGSIAADDATFGGLVTLTGGQVKFPTTQISSADPNTLTDFETGTWTPSLGAVGTGAVDGTHTYITQSGFYTKIGPVVIAAGYCSLSAKDATMAGTFAVVRGFPFASMTLTSARHGGVLSNFGGISNLSSPQNVLSVQLQSNTAFAFIPKGGATFVAPDDIGNSTVIGFSVVYMAAQ